VDKMLIRIGVAISNRNQEEKLVLKLTGISIAMKTEFDIALYSDCFDKLINNIENIDIVLVDFNILERHKETIDRIYKGNINCLPVLLGAAQKKLCDYLIIRPIEYIDSAESIFPEAENDKIKKICNLFIGIANKGFDEKTDNRVIYVTTRQNSYAIPKDTIIYCQSDLKYTVFVLDSGMLIRKLEKLQSVEEKYLWDFKRVHQSFLVNPKWIEGIDKITNEVVLSNNTRIPFSRKYAADLRELFNN